MQILEVAYLSLTSIGGKALPPWAELPRELPGVLTGDWRDTPQFHMNEPMLMFLIMPFGGSIAGWSESLPSFSSANSSPP